MDWHKTILAITSATTSYIFFGALADQQRGIVPLATGRIKNTAGLTPANRVGLFASFLPRAAIPIVLIANISIIMAFTTSYYHPDRIIRQIAFTSAGFLLLLAPLTLGQHLPAINSQLLAFSRAGPKEIEAKGELINQLIITWERKHLWRFISYVGAWACSIAALSIDSGRTKL
ncbi:hypothetical protein BD324DRAFT_628298 [Kockovaella imperatae]|uniref:DUF1772-domain-containing protein n=1 Tax=Kockovaella imperatae TaxID=4999 RepID=A0A1Y1UFL7_9TREE|nr:hypothetical protein BD324DRAFT_628298 [Kockovaella imperatae]ORX36327.1 hypothetical protein BD324DRAFT_628298 [Kockovaella imperatae]